MVALGALAVALASLLEVRFRTRVRRPRTLQGRREGRQGRKGSRHEALEGEKRDTVRGREERNM